MFNGLKKGTHLGFERRIVSFQNTQSFAVLRAKASIDSPKGLRSGTDTWETPHTGRLPELRYERERPTRLVLRRVSDCGKDLTFHWFPEVLLEHLPYL